MQKKVQKNHKNFRNNMPPINKFIWDYHVEIFSGLLMLVGIVLSIFYIHIGSLLVGLSLGICFFDEINEYFSVLRQYYSQRGIFKTLMLIGAVLYFLIAVPAFIIGIAIGFGAHYLFRYSTSK